MGLQGLYRHVAADQRFNVFARGSYDFSVRSGYTELSLFRVKSGQEPARHHTVDLVQPGDDEHPVVLSIYLPVGHPDKPFSANNQVARLFYTDAALGGLDKTTETNTQRYLAGVKGNSSGWDWDAAALYIRTDTKINLQNAPSYERMLQGLAGTGPYGYYRIGANAGLNDPAIYD
jgi:iron complex outermembrane receptor protein